MSEAAPAASSSATSPPSPRRSPADIGGGHASTDDTSGPSSSKDGKEVPMSPDATSAARDDDVPNMETIDGMLSYLEDRCSDWTLAQDHQLATALFHISWYVRRRTREVARAVSSLENRAEKMSISVDSASNELIHRADVQFIENRVSDDDEDEVVDDGSRSRSRRRHRPATSVSSAAGPPSAADGGGTARTGGTGTAGGPETDDESSIRRWREEVETRALVDGMRALPLFVDPAAANHDRRTVEDSPHYYETAEADVFNRRPLPFIIGSPEFVASNDCGLGPPPQPTRPPPEPEQEQEQEQVQESEPGSQGGAIVEDGSGGDNGIDNERVAAEDGGGDETPGSSEDAVEAGADTTSS